MGLDVWYPSDFNETIKIGDMANNVSGSTDKKKKKNRREAR